MATWHSQILFVQNLGHIAISYIDLGQLSIGAPDSDLADAIWSLQRNLGTGQGEAFLKAYGDVTMTEQVKRALKFRYHPSS